jgi:protein kinase-like protein
MGGAVSDETASPRGELAVGSTIAGYRLEEQIGRGGMAVVYRARDLRLERRVALKVLPVESADEEFRERFIRESRAAAAVDHPHIIPIYDAGESGRILYIAMRYVEGGDVWSLVRRHGNLPLDRVCTIVTQVASALDAAHARGLVHRDVKPANILLDKPGGNGHTDHVYLSDFGVNKSSLALPGLTSTGHFVGTLDYVAPEQIEGKHVDGRADAYALACTAFEMLSGAPPFDRDQPMALLWAQISQAAPPLTARRADLPAAIDPVFARALAKSPEDRYPDCFGFAAALRAVARAAAARDVEATQGVRPPTQGWTPRNPPPQRRDVPAAPARARADAAAPSDDLRTQDAGPATEPGIGRPRTPLAPRPPLPGWPDAPDAGGATRRRTKEEEPPRRRRRRGLVIFLVLLVIAAAGATAGIILSSGHLGVITRHSNATGQILSPGVYKNGAYAGPGCPAAAGAGALAVRAGGDGWAQVGGGLPACGREAVASRKTGDVATTQDSYTWTFHLGGPARCAVEIYVANAKQSAGIANYAVYASDLTPAGQMATFDVDQAKSRGHWVAVDATWATGTGEFQVRLTDEADVAGDTGQVTASAAQASCH